MKKLFRIRVNKFYQISNRLIFIGLILLLLSACNERNDKTTPTQRQQFQEFQEDMRAIEIAKKGRNLAGYTIGNVQPDPATLTNDYQIQTKMSSIKGDLQIIGWTALRIDYDTYLVTYTYKKGNESMGWPFEVKLSTELVRSVGGDKELEDKYKWHEVE